MMRFLPVLALLAFPAFAQQDLSKVEITSRQALGEPLHADRRRRQSRPLGRRGRGLPGRRPVRAADAEDRGGDREAHVQAGPVRAQHALALRPHRRQRELRQGRRADRGARERAQAHVDRQLRRVPRHEVQGRAACGAAGGHVHARRDLPPQRRRALRAARAERAHRRRRDRSLPQERRVPHGRHRSSTGFTRSSTPRAAARSRA